MSKEKMSDIIAEVGEIKKEINELKKRIEVLEKAPPKHTHITERGEHVF